MKTPITILSALLLSVAVTQAEEGCEGKAHKKHNPKEHFNKLDADGNGSVSLDEFQATPKGKENPERAAEIFKKIDADGDGSLSVDEIARMHKGRGGQEGNPKEHFGKMDTDGSGSVSLAEFQATPRGKENPERAAEIFSKMDADGNGEMTFEEMVKAHKKRKQHGDRDGGKQRPEGEDEAPDGGAQVD